MHSMSAGRLVLCAMAVHHGAGAPPVMPELQSGPAAVQCWCDSLTVAQVAAVARGELVLRKQAVRGSPWPRVRVYRFVEADPLDGAAMMHDYERQPAYIPQVRAARIIERPGVATAHVRLRFAVPVLPDQEYVVRDSVHTAPGGAFAVTWTLVAGSSVDRIDGSAVFTPWINPQTGKRGSVLVYEQLVVPRSVLMRLPWIKSRAVAGVRDAVRAIAAEIERVATRDPALSARQRAALRAALVP